MWSIPGWRRRHSLVDRGSYHLLIPEFRELIDFYTVYELNRGKRESTIYTESHNTASFLDAMQARGCKSLDMITEEDVLAFFSQPLTDIPGAVPTGKIFLPFLRQVPTGRKMNAERYFPFCQCCVKREKTFSI